MNTMLKTQHLNSANSDLGAKLDQAVLRLLIAQYKATGATKREQVLACLRDRIEGLGGTAPLCCVWKKRIAASIELVHATIAIVPLLDGFFRNGTKCDGRYVTPVSCAMADAFKVASNKDLIGTDLESLMHASAQNAVVNADDGRTPEQIKQDVQAAHMRILSSMMLPVDAYIALLSCIPKLVLERTHFETIWLEDHNVPGQPLRQMYDDVRRIGRLLPYLHNPQRTEMALAIGVATEALKAREQVADKELTGRQQAQQQRNNGKGFAPRVVAKG